MKIPRILIAEDHKVVAQGLRCLFEKRFEVVGTVGDGQALVLATRELAPDLIVADIEMPLLNGLEAARRIKQESPEIKIIFLSRHGRPEYIAEALTIGAEGYLLKRCSFEEMIKAVREVAAGRPYITPLAAPGAPAPSLERPSPKELTTRQRQVLALVAEGQSVKEISVRLKISAKTVEFHKYGTMEKLGIATTAGLIRYAVSHGLVPA